MGDCLYCSTWITELVDIADGKASDVGILKRALEGSGANLLISSIHLIDLSESTPSTKQRWIDAITTLAPLRFAMEPGSQVPTDRDGLVALVRDVAPDVSAVRSVLAARQQAKEAVRTARLGSPKPRFENPTGRFVDNSHARSSQPYLRSTLRASTKPELDRLRRWQRELARYRQAARQPCIEPSRFQRITRPST